MPFRRGRHGIALGFENPIERVFRQRNFQGRWRLALGEVEQDPLFVQLTIGRNHQFLPKYVCIFSID
jgi:hypothetical protein